MIRTRQVRVEELQELPVRLIAQILYTVIIFSYSSFVVIRSLSSKISANKISGRTVISKAAILSDVRATLVFLLILTNRHKTTNITQLK